MIKIGYIERNDLLREAISHALNNNEMLDVCFNYKDCDQLKASETLSEIDLLLFDTELDPNFSIIQKLQELYPKLKFILLSPIDQLNSRYSFYKNEKIRVIARKEISLNGLLSTVLEFCSDKMTPSTLRNIALTKMRSKSAFFSGKECIILKLIGQGKTNKEISERIQVSHRTIETHRRRMIERLGSTNIIPVVLFAQKKGYIHINFDEIAFWESNTAKIFHQDIINEKLYLDE